MDIMNISFKEMEDIFNEFVNNNVKTTNDIYPETIKADIYTALNPPAT